MKDENCEKIKNVLRVIFYPLVLIRRKIFVYLCEYYRKRDLKKNLLLYYIIIFLTKKSIGVLRKI